MLKSLLAPLTGALLLATAGAMPVQAGDKAMGKGCCAKQMMCETGNAAFHSGASCCSPTCAQEMVAGMKEKHMDKGMCSFCSNPERGNAAFYTAQGCPMCSAKKMECCAGTPMDEERMRAMHRHKNMPMHKMDHSKMDHSKMDHSKMDHSKMDHSKMDHSKMDHSGAGHSHWSYREEIGNRRFFTHSEPTENLNVR